jgi:hypothetical protein
LAPEWGETVIIAQKMPFFLCCFWWITLCYHVRSTHFSWQQLLGVFMESEKACTHTLDIL